MGGEGCTLIACCQKPQERVHLAVSMLQLWKRPHDVGTHFIDGDIVLERDRMCSYSCQKKKKKTTHLWASRPRFFPPDLAAFQQKSNYQLNVQDFGKGNETFGTGWGVCGLVD